VVKLVPKVPKHLEPILRSEFEDAGRDDKIRSETITGTDMGAILGVSPYKTRWDVVASKRNMPCTARQESDAMAIGTYLQRGVAALYSRSTGWKEVILWDDKTIRSDKYPWASCTPDARLGRMVLARTNHRLTLDMGGGRTALAEIKTAGNARMADWGPSGSDIYPKHYGIQCAWNCLVTGADYCVLIVLLGGPVLELRSYTIVPSQALKDYLLVEGKKFWDEFISPNVPPDKMPEIQDSVPARTYLDSLEDSGDWREPTDEEIDLAHEYYAANLEAKALADRKADIAAKLKLSIGDKTGLVWPGNKVSNKSYVDVDGKKTRRLLVKLSD